jgi:hypothetical protein
VGTRCDQNCKRTQSMVGYGLGVSVHTFSLYGGILNFAAEV